MRLEGLRRLMRSAARPSGASDGAAPPPSEPDDLGAFLRALCDVIQRMDRNPPASFANSFAGEFDSLQRIDRDAVRNMHIEFETSVSAENELKNRYPNILCNERSRVKLRDGEHDYINANSISGFPGHRGYIATQAPLPATMPAFWQMVYEDKCPVIVMLTRVQEVQCYYPKCDRYWPSSGACILFDRYYVIGLSERTDQSLGIIERKFRVGKTARTASSSAPAPADVDVDFRTPVRGNGRGSNPAVRPELVDMDDDEARVQLQPEGEEIEVTQIQYVDWPDQGVPDVADTLLTMCGRVDELCAKAPGRPVIHCSAGVGRTGTFIAVHKLLQAVYAAYPTGLRGGEIPVPVVEVVLAGLKKERSKMVQTPEQYRFIFIALAEGVQLYRNKITAERTR